MSWNAGVVKALPLTWEGQISFKLMKPGDRIGYVDTIPDKTSYKLVTAGQKPLASYAIDMPMDCTTLASIQAANKLTLTVKLDERTWKSLDQLDREFDKFLVENSTKLFGVAEGDYLKKNPSAISLKRSKRLAPVNASGEPLYDGRLKLRINGRSLEIESVVMADGPRGQYVKSAVWSSRTSPLPTKATRFSMVTGHTALDFQGSSMPIVRDTLPHAASSFAGPGAGHVRFIGPGDMGRNSIIHHLLFRPAYWTNVGGGFMITLSAEHVIFENCEAGDSGGAAGGGDEERFKPDGFMRDPQETGAPSPSAFSSVAIELPPQSASKRRITIGNASEASRWAAGAGAEPVAAHGRSMTGGGALSRSDAIFGEEEEDE
jgi:hypothetical protein